MAALEGFEMTIATGDVVVAMGTYDGVYVPGVTIDVSAESLGDGENLIVIYAGAVEARAASSGVTADEVKLGEFTEDTAAATAVTYAGRGAELPVSADV